MRAAGGPFGLLPVARLISLAEGAHTLACGQTRARAQAEAVYVLSLEGVLLLQTDHASPLRLTSGRVALVDAALTLTAQGHCRYLVVDAGSIDRELVLHALGTSGVFGSCRTELVEAALRVPRLRDIPIDRLDRLANALQRLHVNAGDTLAREGRSGRHMYLLEEGRAERWLGRDAVVMTLRPGDHFGSETLQASTPYTSNVRMTCNGVVRKLDRKDFQALMQPDIGYCQPATFARAFVALGDELLDLRSSEEYRRTHLAQSHSLPFTELDRRMGDLSRHKRHVLICRDGTLSAAACLILAHRGIPAVCVEGGLQGWHADIDAPRHLSGIVLYRTGHTAQTDQPPSEPPVSSNIACRYNDTCATPSSGPPCQPIRPDEDTHGGRQAA